MDEQHVPPPANGGERPTVLIVLGVLNCVIGAVMLALVPVGLFIMLMSSSDGFGNLPSGMKNPAIEAMEQPGYRMFSFVTMATGAIADLALIAGGVGLLKQRRWGRTISLAYAVYTLLISVAAGVVQYRYGIEPLMLAARQSNDPQMIGAAIGGVVGGTCSTCFVALYPIVLLFFLNRPIVLRALSIDSKSADRGSAG